MLKFLFVSLADKLVITEKLFDWCVVNVLALTSHALIFFVHHNFDVIEMTPKLFDEARQASLAVGKQHRGTFERKLVLNIDLLAETL